MSETIYSDFITTKINSLIPVLKSGKTIESRYNPQREAENIINNFDKNYSAFLIPGIGSGLLIEYIHKLFPAALIIVYENSSKDYDFLTSNDSIKKILSIPELILSNSTTLYSDLLQKYIPAKYGDLKLIQNQNWLNENKNNTDLFFQILNKALENIKTDFSVQSHFGKIWMSNFFKNLKILEKNKNEQISAFPINKTAVIVGAGPSLDSIIEQYSDKNKFFIISTDTAISVLLKHNVIPDVVVSIDGQPVSRSHFITSYDLKNILFLFDITSNSSAIKNVLNKKGNVQFFVTGHPISFALNQYLKNSLPVLFSGSGTVTITALDFAVKSGFKNIHVIGADFSYHHGKSYVKGTYLDALYNLDSSKISTSELIYDKLLYRTELIKENDLYKTKVLDSYKHSFIEYLKSNNLSFDYKDFIYYINNKNINTINFTSINFDLKSFINYINNLDSTSQEIILLPYISFLRKNPENKDKTFDELVKLAHSFIVSYN